jgi:hypothetical protein
MPIPLLLAKRGEMIATPVKRAVVGQVAAAAALDGAVGEPPNLPQAKTPLVAGERMKTGGAEKELDRADRASKKSH